MISCCEALLAGDTNMVRTGDLVLCLPLVSLLWILPFVICFFLWVSTRNPPVYSAPSLWGFFWSYVQGAFLCPAEFLNPVHYFFLNVYFTNSLVLFDISFLSYLNKTQGRKL